MAKNQTIKICHVCGNENSEQARFCSQCGAALPIKVNSSDQSGNPHNNYHYHFGESDLMEGELQWRSGWYVLVGVVFAMVLALILVALYGITRLGNDQDIFMGQTPTSAIDQNISSVTNTPPATITRPTLQLSTVTPAPPTATPTPTLGPCERQVTSNDTLIGLISSCGHRDLDVMDEVLELNGLSDPSAIRLGETIQIPRPTATPDPNVTPDPTDADVNTSSSGSFADLLFADGAEGLPTFTPSPQPTLPPGVMWHTVVKDETIISVVNRYSAGVEILSQLNPEMTFSQCEFSPEMPYGGPSCTVFLIEGMRMRVPAPTPTPTLSPTPSGSETPTPSATPTFNAPNLISPGNRVVFGRNDLITLRWSPTGTLGADEIYRVHVYNLQTNVTYRLDTRDTSIILPVEWQEPDGGRYDYQWEVSIINLNQPEQPLFSTESRIFTWEAANQSQEEE